ncbi:MAG: hypothetical protein ABIF40_05865 [archaeon]
MSEEFIDALCDKVMYCLDINEFLKLNFNYPLTEIYDAAVNASLSPVIQDYVVGLLQVMLDYSSQSSEISESDLRRISWKTVNSLQSGLNVKESVTLIQTIRQSLLEDFLEEPVTLDRDDGQYNVQRIEKKIYITKLN